MASCWYATSLINHNVFICIFVSLLLPIAHESATNVYDKGRSSANDQAGRRLTREYHLRQGALRGLVVQPSRQYRLQSVEMFLGIPYAAAPTGSLRFMPPVSAPLWPGVKMATEFGPVCPQSLPQIKKRNPPSLGRQQYLSRLKPFLTNESEDCLTLNIYVPYREQKSKKFPILVFIHGDSFEWGSGNPYDGRVLASYGNIMVISLNYRLGILGFMKPSLTEHEYGNNGLLDQLAALQWLKDNAEDLNGDPAAVTLMGHGAGAACINYLMLSPISTGLFHRAILMSGSALADWALTKDPSQYTLQVAQALACNPNSDTMMKCLQNKPLSAIKKVQVLAREFETPLAPIVAGSLIPNEPATTMDSFPNLLKKYQLLSGVTELDCYHEFGVIELDHGVLDNQRDDFITKYAKVVFDGAENLALKEILKKYGPPSADPRRWSVESNREVVLAALSDARVLAPMVRLANYQATANSRSYFYVFGHNSISTSYAPLNKSVNGAELPYVLGVPLGEAHTHFHTDYTLKEQLLSEVVMRLWTNFVKMGTPNTQSKNEYYALGRTEWEQFDKEWPEYDVAHQSYLRLDIPPFVRSLYRANYTNFWIDTLPNKMKKYVIDPLFAFTSSSSTHRPRSPHTDTESTQQILPQVRDLPSTNYIPPAYGRIRPYATPQQESDPDIVYKQIQSIKTPARQVPSVLLNKDIEHTLISTEDKVNKVHTNISSATVTLIVTLVLLFFAINIGICILLYIKKQKKQQKRSHDNTRQARAEVGEVDVIGQKCSKEEKTALQTFKNSCSVIKSINFNKNRKDSVSKRKKLKIEQCKTARSDDSGGFRERFQLRRHLSTSTLDANTKVRDWIANEVMHRCSPNILRKSNSELRDSKCVSASKPFTRSEELLSDSGNKKELIKVSHITHSDKNGHKKRKRTSHRTTSTTAVGSHSSMGSKKNQSGSMSKSDDSIKSKENESVYSKKVSVAIDATPAARNNSILKQEPIELTGSYNAHECHHVHKLQKTLKDCKEECLRLNSSLVNIEKPSNEKIFTNVVSFSLREEKPLQISHKHSTSDPVTDTNYVNTFKAKHRLEDQINNMLPPVIFRNEINVTSKDENGTIKAKGLTPAEALLTIKRRNFPKVLPDLPVSQKRLSLQPTAFQTFRCFEGKDEGDFERNKQPPHPPPRTTTLDLRTAYKNTLSFEAINERINTASQSINYENIGDISPHNFISKSYDTFDHRMKIENTDTIFPTTREYPRVIIASSDIPTSQESTIIIKPSPSFIEIPKNVPRVRLPDDFHSHATSSITSFSSFCSNNDAVNMDGEFTDGINEDKLIEELVGRAESPTKIGEIFDSKGPETVFEKKLEIVPVKLNPIYAKLGNTDDFVCISNLFLPDLTSSDKTAQIKSNLGLNKLQSRSESINKPPERAVQLKQKRTLKSTISISRNKNNNDKKQSDSVELEHSHSGSSNDTETSTGTVKKVVIK